MLGLPPAGGGGGGIAVWGGRIQLRKIAEKLRENCEKLRKIAGKLRENCDVVSGPPEPSRCNNSGQVAQNSQNFTEQIVHGQYNYRRRPSISPWNCSMNRRRRMLSSNLCCRFETVPTCEKKRSTSPPEVGCVIKNSMKA